MIKTLIVAMDENRVIGKQGQLPWAGKMATDMARFKSLTIHHPIIMGSKTFESIGNRALPQRQNVVITRDRMKRFSGAMSEASLDDALQLVEVAFRPDEVFIIGGGEIYKEALSLSDRLYVTIVHTEVAGGDTFFPKIDKNVWKETSHEHFDADEKNEFEYEFITYERSARGGSAPGGR